MTNFLNMFLRTDIFILGISLFLCQFVTSPCYAAMPNKSNDIIAHGLTLSMNDISLTDLGDFIHKWHFVTVRFRTDKGEQRITYANDLAWNALKAHSTDYPDGAKLAKIAIITGQDPAFEDSLVPSGASVVQVMVRDHHKYKDTEGWGYAIFKLSADPAINEIAPSQSKQSEMSQACAACHAIVPQRGLVFSQIASFLGPDFHSMEADKALVAFKDVRLSTLDLTYQNLFPPSIKTVRVMQSPLTEIAFNGTLNEAKILMATEAAVTNKPVFFISKKGWPQFAALWPQSIDSKVDDACSLPAHHKGRMVAGVTLHIVESEPPETRAHINPFPAFCAPLPETARATH